MISLVLQFKRRPIAILCPFRSDLWLDEKDLRSRKEIFPLLFNLPFLSSCSCTFLALWVKLQGHMINDVTRKDLLKTFFPAVFPKNVVLSMLISFMLWSLTPCNWSWHSNWLNHPYHRKSLKCLQRLLDFKPDFQVLKSSESKSSES